MLHALVVRDAIPGIKSLLLGVLLLFTSVLWSVEDASACPPGPDLNGAPKDETIWTQRKAHPDTQFEADNQDPYSGDGWLESEGGSPSISFSSSGVTLRSWITLDEFAPSATDGTDCWGYTAPSGREYALVGLNTGTGIADVTDPGNAQIIGHIPGASSIWRDIKTYQDHAYIVSEGGGGIQVYDLSDIDSGNFTDQGSVLTGPGTLASHNVAINEQSARLYRAGGGTWPIEGIRIYSLANLSAPAYLGTWNARYCHDVQVVTWTEPPYVGAEIGFCYANDTAGSGSPGVEIVDLTDPSNVVTLGSIDLSVAPIFSHPASYGHQGWLSPNRDYVYYNDEVDEGNQGFATTTRVIDVRDLTNPAQVAIFQNSTDARDHNLYTLDDRVYQANYRSGFRLLDSSDPLLMSEIAYFDTYPDDDDAHYNGLWSIYPYFPSKTVIGCDIEKGLFVWTVDADELSVPVFGRGATIWLVVSLLLVALWALRTREGIWQGPTRPGLT